ncbi:MAG: YceI family protein [Hyphomonadaceae bacterium]|jgi:polyisoprenoid-binding protein YceI|nr:YceI family protein [Hyphomonadaceae bacterium]
MRVFPVLLATTTLALTGALGGCISVGPTTVVASEATASTETPQQINERAAVLARQPAGAYAVDSTHAGLHFSVNHWGLSQYTMRFDQVSGTLDFNPTNPTASRVDVRINPRSIHTGIAEFDAKIANDALKAEANPEIRFVSTSLSSTGATRGTMTGDLTLAGVTKPVTLDVAFNGGRPNPFAGGRAQIGFSATGTFKRSDFGVTNWSQAVGDDVTVRIEIEFLQAAG